MIEVTVEWTAKATYLIDVVDQSEAIDLVHAGEIEPTSYQQTTPVVKCKAKPKDS